MASSLPSGPGRDLLSKLNGGWVDIEFLRNRLGVGRDALQRRLANLVYIGMAETRRYRGRDEYRTTDKGKEALGG